MERKKFLNLSDYDIKKNKFMYTPEQIEYSIIHINLSLRNLYKNQKLTPYICAKYVIFGGNNEEYGDCTEDRWIADGDILQYQTHITDEELSDAHYFVEDEENREDEEKILLNYEDNKK